MPGGISSSLWSVNLKVPQSFVLGPLLYLHKSSLMASSIIYMLITFKSVSPAESSHFNSRLTFQMSLDSPNRHLRIIPRLDSGSFYSQASPLSFPITANANSILPEASQKPWSHSWFPSCSHISYLNQQEILLASPSKSIQTPPLLTTSAATPGANQHHLLPGFLQESPKLVSLHLPLQPEWSLENWSQIITLFYAKPSVSHSSTKKKKSNQNMGRWSK